MIVKVNNTTTISNQFESVPTSEKVIVGTYHKDKKVFGGIYTDNKFALTGVSSNYLLFNELENDTSIDRKFVDETPRDINETVSFIEESKK